MKVVIDGIEYVPARSPAPPPTEKELAALEVRLDSDAGKNITVRDYLFRLLDTLWMDGEDFHSKRPFGNSGWQYELYNPLVRNGFIAGTFSDSDDEWAEVSSTIDADRFVCRLIRAIFYSLSSQ